VVLVRKLMCCEFVRGTETPVSLSLLNQAFRMLVVKGQSLRLLIGAIRAPDIWTFVPCEACPSQVIVESPLCICNKTTLICLLVSGPLTSYCLVVSHLVCVFETQQKLAASGLCEKIIVQCRPQRSKVQISCRRRGKASTARRFWEP